MVPRQLAGGCFWLPLTLCSGLPPLWTPRGPGVGGNHDPLPFCLQGSGSSQVPQSKYAELLAIIEELGKEIRPTYAGSKSAMERLKRGGPRGPPSGRLPHGVGRSWARQLGAGRGGTARGRGSILVGATSERRRPGC